MLGTGQDSVMSRFYGIEDGPVEAETVFQCSRVRSLHEWWLSAAGGALPLWRQFDILDHKFIVEHLFVIECRPEGDFFFRLLGERSIEMLGRNPRGTTIGRNDTDVYGHALYEYYSRIVADRRPRRCTGTLAFADRSWKRFESLDCPLSRTGERVDLILGVMDLLPD